ncbi:MAG: hypothetical protein OM95_03490 [Bdellovibrio sp. ArHS]|uniref:DUF4423 domain-containing protein n=1 Tax=Bdellovibrio sp. ArHS TaxID=1569284 RepID=UPI000582B248|nr:DUF4423 domain-containing protein [Bdellovibrio sp. ArHS]KHD89439.1 MAG: hypothetical protein OM95_03490 [Bdellovibrio sp. ArHS]
MENWSEIFKYDIKQVLQRVLQEKQETHPSFSQRDLAAQLGMAPSTLNEILKGKRALSKKTLGKIKDLFHEDTHFQEVLRSHDKEKFKLFFAENRQLTEISNKWYFEALLELISTDDFREDSAWMAARLGISEKEVQAAIDNLLAIGEIRYNKFGRLSVAFDNTLNISEGDLRKATLKKGRSHISKLESTVEELSFEERFFSSMVIAMCPSDFEYLRTKMVDFIKEQQQFLSRDGTKKTEVYQLTMGMVPLTRKVDGSA